MSCASQPDVPDPADVMYMVQKVLENSRSMMEADQRLRPYQDHLGRRLAVTGGVLTAEVLQAVQAKCQAHFAKVTPGHVSLLSSLLSCENNNLDAVFQKLDDLRRIAHRQGRVRCGECTFTIEDIMEAEKGCREKCGLLSAATPSASSSQPPPTGPDESPEKATFLRIKKPRVNLARDAGSDDNAKFIAEHVLGNCSSAENARRFLSWLRGKHFVKGRFITPTDVDDAERRCEEYWVSGKIPDGASDHASAVNGVCSSMQTQTSPPGTGISGSKVVSPTRISTGDSRRPPALRQPASKSAPERNVLDDNAMASRTSQSGESTYKEGAENQNARQAQASVPHVKQEHRQQAQASVPHVKQEHQQQAKEAQNSVQHVKQEHQQPAAEDPSCLTSARLNVGVGDRASSSSDVLDARSESNVELMVRRVLHKSESREQINEFFRSLRANAGEVNKTGRIFSTSEIGHARRKCLEAFQNETVKDEDDGSAVSECSEVNSPSSASSVSSISDRSSTNNYRQRGHGRGRGRGIWRKKSLTSNDKDVDGALFDNSGSESLSGEEGVDLEQNIPSFEAFVDVARSIDALDVLDDNYPAATWNEVSCSVLPGHDGFNSRATDVMRKADVGNTKLLLKYDANAACPPSQPHQESVKFLVHPQSPVTRLLVDHPTGSGKTREMISVLDNFFYDPRPKIPIFPRDVVCRNFYCELLRWPSRYRDYFSCEEPDDAAIACGREDWKSWRFHSWPLDGLREHELRRLCVSIRDVLEMKHMFFNGKVNKRERLRFRRKHPGEPMPVAPLRALGYVSAGGCFSYIGDNGSPMSALMKIGYERGSGNVYSNKVVLMDEVHNLVRTQSQYSVQLQRLRHLLFNARSLVLAGFTGTPILNEPSEGRQLLDVIKGQTAPDGDEGFLSSFPMRPQPLFPLSLPRGVPDALLTVQRKRQLVTKVELHGEALRVYDYKHRIGLPSRRLQAYCNVSVWFGSFHDGKCGAKTKVLCKPRECCPKLFEIAQAVVNTKEKSIILTGRSSGYNVMLALMQLMAGQASPPFAVATIDQLADFNQIGNIHGQRFRVLVADALQCSEGISFLAVRHTFLADVPVSPSSFIQQCGRAIRMYGHRGLPDEEQTVTNHLYVAVLPKWMRSSTLACWAMRAQKQQRRAGDLEKEARLFTSRLGRVGIRSLSDLKSRIDAHAKAKQEHVQCPDTQGSEESTRYELTARDVADIFKGMGLANEAEALQRSVKRDCLEHPEHKFDPKGTGHQQVPTGRVEALQWATSLLTKLKQELNLNHNGVALDMPADEAISRRASINSVLLQLWQSDHVAPTIHAIDAVTKHGAVTGFANWTDGQLECLDAELSRLKIVEDSTPSKPRGLVRSVQALHRASSADDPTLSYSTLTADEEALQQLTEKTKEFVPALASLRALAVDREIFQSLADPAVDEADDDLFVESEPSDIEEEEIMWTGKGLVLPKGWHLELVERGRKNVREFVNPDGKRFRNTKEMRAHVTELQRREAGLAAVVKRLHEPQLVKREGNTTPCNEPQQSQKGVASIVSNAAVNATAMDAGLRSKVVPKRELTERDKLVGSNIVVQGLKSMPEFNGRRGYLVKFLEDKGRWECRLADLDTAFNLKTENFRLMNESSMAGVSVKCQDDAETTGAVDESSMAGVSVNCQNDAETTGAVDAPGRNVRRRCKGPQ